MQKNLKDDIASSTEIPNHQFVKVCDAPFSFCLSTYNILADIYNGYGVRFAQRGDRIARELASVSSNIVCLQETERHSFDFIKEKLALTGSFLKNANGDGVGILFDAKIFKSDALLDLDFPSWANAAVESEKEGTVLQRVLKKIRALRHHSVAQVAILTHLETKKKVCVVTSHLYWGAQNMSENYQIQLVQWHILGIVLGKFLTDHNAMDIPRIFCGDCNATAKHTFYKFVHSGVCDEDDKDLNYGIGPSIAKSKLVNPFLFKSSYFDDEPAITCMPPGFAACVDFIFYDKLQVCERIKMKSQEQMLKDHESIPDKYYPSDHLMLSVRFGLN